MDTRGRPDLQPGPLADNLDWVINEWAPGQTTDIAEVQERFAPVFLEQFGAQGIADFMNHVRTTWAGAEFPQDRGRVLCAWRRCV